MDLWFFLLLALSLTHTLTNSTHTALVSFTYGVAPLQFSTPWAAVLGVGSVVILHAEARGCLGNRWSGPVEG